MDRSESRQDTSFKDSSLGRTKETTAMIGIGAEGEHQRQGMIGLDSFYQGIVGNTTRLRKFRLRSMA